MIQVKEITNTGTRQDYINKDFLLYHWEKQYIENLTQAKIASDHGRVAIFNKYRGALSALLSFAHASGLITVEKREGLERELNILYDIAHDPAVRAAVNTYERRPSLP